MYTICKEETPPRQSSVTTEVPPIKFSLQIHSQSYLTFLNGSKNKNEMECKKKEGRDNLHEKHSD